MKLKEVTIGSTEVFTGKLVKLRVDTVRLPDGREATREIVVHRGAVTAVPIVDTNKIIMVRQYRQAAGETLLEIPAGTLDPGEEPYKCAVRELKEEIGYSPRKLTLMFRSYLAPGYSSEVLHTFLAEDLTRADARPDEDEFLEVVQIPLDEALDMIHSGDIKDAKTICGITMAERILASR